MEIAAPFFPWLLHFFISLAPPFLIHALRIYVSARQHLPFGLPVPFEMKKGAGQVIL